MVRAQSDDGASVGFAAVVRVDSSTEARYLRHGGVLPYVARSMAAAGSGRPSAVVLG